MSTLTRPERWAALAAVWVDAVAASVVHPLGSVSWQALGSCGARAELPWTAEPDQVGPWDAESMRSLCRACPARAECAAYVAQADVCAGWWAGTNRDPDFVEPARPSWVPVRSPRARGDVEQGLLPLTLPSGDAA
jgi:hypothetical protein